MRTTYTADDGATFNTEAECRAYERVCIDLDSIFAPNSVDAEMRLGFERGFLMYLQNGFYSRESLIEYRLSLSRLAELLNPEISFACAEAVGDDAGEREVVDIRESSSGHGDNHRADRLRAGKQGCSYGCDYGSDEWLAALDYPEKVRPEVVRNRKIALRNDIGRPNAKRIQRFRPNHSEEL
jgi:hypothetical protein